MTPTYVSIVVCLFVFSETTSFNSTTSQLHPASQLLTKLQPFRQVVRGFGHKAERPSVEAGLLDPGNLEVLGLVALLVFLGELLGCFLVLLFSLNICC